MKDNDFTYEKFVAFLKELELEETTIPTKPAVVPQNVALENSLRNNIQSAEEEIAKHKETIFRLQKQIRGWRNQINQEKDRIINSN